MFDYSKVGEKIKSQRMQLNIKQKDLADSVGITPQTLSKYENTTGKTGSLPSVDVLILIAKKLNVSLDWLCGLSETNIKETTETETTLEPIINDFLHIISLLNDNHVCYAISPEGSEYMSLKIYHCKLANFFIDYKKILELRENINNDNIYKLIVDSLIKNYINYPISESDCPF